jgi:hypothetical protein
MRVKWSQVQILSSRRLGDSPDDLGNLQVTGAFPCLGLIIFRSWVAGKGVIEKCYMERNWSGGLNRTLRRFRIPLDQSAWGHADDPQDGRIAQNGHKHESLGLNLLESGQTLAASARRAGTQRNVCSGGRVAR